MFRIITKLVTGRRPSMQLAPSRAVRRRSGACTLPHRGRARVAWLTPDLHRLAARLPPLRLCFVCARERDIGVLWHLFSNLCTRTCMRERVIVLLCCPCVCSRAGLAPRCPPTAFAPGGETIPFRVLGDHNDEAWFQNKPDDTLAK